MKEILLTALLLACPLGMLAIGALAWAGTRLRSAPNHDGTATQTGASEQSG